MDWPIVFAVGMVGALAPEVIRWRTIVVARQRGQKPEADTIGEKEDKAFTRDYALVTLLYIALGGFVAIVLPVNTLHGAFYAGASWPVLVNTAHKRHLQQRPKATEITTSGSSDEMTGRVPRPKTDTSRQAAFVNAL